jgi:uncharacterized protein (TIGR00369 family)
MSDSLVSLDALNAVIEDSPFLTRYGVQVTSCALGQCEVMMPFNESLERSDGLISGMALMGAADVAFWLAIMTARGLDETWVTSDMQTAFLRSGRDENIVCSARVLRIGRGSVYGTAECRGSDSADLLSHHTMRWAKVSGEPPA